MCTLGDFDYVLLAVFDCSQNYVGVTSTFTSEKYIHLPMSKRLSPTVLSGLHTQYQSELLVTAIFVIHKITFQIDTTVVETNASGLA